MSSEAKHHIVPFRTYLLILLGLITLTLLSVEVTHIDLREYTVAMALIIAGVKSYFVLSYFMHLRFDKPMYRNMVLFVLAVFLAVVTITFIDYINR